ncbi:MAG TPA: DNA/RNA helicase, partial [Firmicutes bacterium]|nr:DNA/RNA helicase [Bacillota bacterium]
MAYFVPGDNFENAGGKAEEIVWKRVKEAFNARNVLGYSKYPFYKSMGGKRREPDIILLDQNEGLVVFEVKGYTINQIEKIEPNNWYLRDCYEKTVNPINQVNDYVYSIISAKFEVEGNLRGKVKGRGLVVLPYISCKEWEDKGFAEITTNWPIIFKDDLTKQRLLYLLLNMDLLKIGQSLTREEFILAQSILGHEGVHVEDEDSFLPEGTKGRVLNDLKTQMLQIDLQQEGIGKSIAPGPQRIRGIAGSGKTLLLCQKAAYMHLKYPEWKIVYTFYTRSLYDIVTRTIDMYLKAFSNGEVCYDPNSNLQVMHAWGGKHKPGLYSSVANENFIKPLTVEDCKKEFKGFVSMGTQINYISKILLENLNGNLKRIYDVILIDEGQDLIAPPEQLYKGQHSFYFMAYHSLKQHDVEGKKIRRLVWAYDELQNLDNNIIPSWKEIIGDDEVLGKGAVYKGGIKKSEVMKKCYRVPHEILPIAHALGMGWFRKDGMLTGYTRKDQWEDIGYKVEGDFRKDNSEIILTRNREDSINLLSDIYNGSVIEFEQFNSNND